MGSFFLVKKLPVALLVAFGLLAFQQPAEIFI